MQALIPEAIDAIDFKIRTTCQGFDPLLDTHRATVALDSVLGSLAKIPQSSQSDSKLGLRLEQVIARLARQFGIGQSQIKLRLGDLRKQTRRFEQAGSELPRSSLAEPLIEYRYSELSVVELELLEILALNTDLVPMAIERIASKNLTSSTALAIFQLYLDLELEGHALDFQSVLTASEDPGLKNTLVTIQQHALLKASKTTMDSQTRLETLCQHWADQDQFDPVRSQRNALQDSTLDEQTQLDLLQSLIRQAQLKHGIEQP
jgi:DNA primase